MNVQKSQYTREEIGRIGDEVYRRDIRSQVLPEHKGEFLVVNQPMFCRLSSSG